MFAQSLSLRIIYAMRRARITMTETRLTSCSSESEREYRMKCEKVRDCIYWWLRSMKQQWTLRIPWRMRRATLGNNIEEVELAARHITPSSSDAISLTWRGTSQRIRQARVTVAVQEVAFHERFDVTISCDHARAATWCLPDNFHL